MQPSSLIFLMIVVGWLVYLLPQWVRRRDALGAARGRDRHSTGLRVLTRRHHTAPARSSLPLLTGRLGTGVFVDDDALDAENGLLYVPPVAPDLPPGPPVEDLAAAGAPADRPHIPTARTPLPPPVPRVPPPAVRVPPPAPTNRKSVPAAVNAPAAEPGLSSAQRRTAVLVVLALVTAVSWAAVAGGIGSLLVAVPSSVLLAGYVALLRSAARRRQARRAAAAARRELAARAARRAAATHAVPAPRPETVAFDQSPPERHDTAVRQPAPEVDVVDLTAAERPDDGTWVPVPVPPPTYTLKAMAPARPAPAPPRPEPVEDAVTVIREGAQTVDLDDILARRRAVND